jgi:tetratricopeptide (TPR) repeat protein
MARPYAILLFLALLGGLIAFFVVIAPWAWRRNGHETEVVRMGLALERGDRAEVMRLSERWRVGGYPNESRVALARLALLEQSPREALEHLRGIPGTGPMAAEASMLAGDSLLMLRQAGEAYLAYQHSISLDPRLYGSRLGLSATLMELGSLEPAAGQALEATELDDTDGRAWHVLASVQFQMQLWDESAESARKALERRLPRSSRLELQSMLAQWHLEHGRLEEARTTITNRGALDTGSGRQLALMGWLENLEGKTATGIASLETACRMAPQDADIPIWLADAQMRSGNWAEVLAAASKAQALSPDKPAPYHLMGQALDRLNRPAEATIQRARQEEVRRLLGVMTQLSSRADADPLNAEVREQLAQTSEQLGRNDWARSWRETSKASLQLRTNPP